MTQLPRHARAVIIGGGVVGCSVAYHLAKLGWTDVVLLERKRLTSGTTWHAAGLIGQLRATLTLTLLAKYTADLYTKLEAETELATGFRQNGSVSIALTEERFEELKRQASMAAAVRCRRDTCSRRRKRRRAIRSSSARTWSAASSFPPTGRPIPPTSRRRWPRARA